LFVIELANKPEDIPTMFEIVMISPEEIIYQGKAESAIFPGESGVFETLSYHRPVVSRLVGGSVFIDNREYPIRRGLMGFSNNKATVIVERNA
jgi:F0F1-type ATP synthase epsilon subunit